MLTLAEILMMEFRRLGLKRHIQKICFYPQETTAGKLGVKHFKA